MREVDLQVFHHVFNKLGKVFYQRAAREVFYKPDKTRLVSLNDFKNDVQYGA